MIGPADEGPGPPERVAARARDRRLARHVDVARVDVVIEPGGRGCGLRARRRGDHERDKHDQARRPRRGRRHQYTPDIISRRLR